METVKGRRGLMLDGGGGREYYQLGGGGVAVDKFETLLLTTLSARMSFYCRMKI